MQSAGVKRQFSGSEGEDNSPEYLLPVKDPYPSDDEKDTNVLSTANRYKLPGNSKAFKNPIYRTHVKSSEISAAEALFFFDMDYEVDGDETNITKLSTVEILNHLFRFVEEDKGNHIEEGIELRTQDVTWKNQSIEEVYNKALNKNPVLAWIEEHDSIELKNYPHSGDQFKEIMEACRKYQSDISDVASSDLAWKLNEWDDMIGMLRRQCKQGFTDHNVMKEIFRSFRVIGKLPPMRLSKQTQYVYDVYVPSHIVSEDSIIHRNRYVPMTVQSDAVFKDNVKNADKASDKIVLQIFSSKSEEAVSNSGNSENSSDLSNFKKSKNKINQPSVLNASSRNKIEKPKKKSQFDSNNNKPPRLLNAIQRDGYLEQTRNYFSSRVPSLCKDDVTLNKITGQHLLQLLGLARCMVNNNGRSTFPVGIFAKNECIILSKLWISFQRMLQIFTIDGENDSNEDCVEPRGLFSYSPWTLDLSLPKHRLALIIFLSEYLDSF